MARKETERWPVDAEKDCRVSKVGQDAPQELHSRRVCPMEVLHADDSGCLFAEVRENELDRLMEPRLPVFGTDVLNLGILD